jgi:hypothetical protein
MSDDFYGNWHTGVEIDTATRRWRAYVAHPDTDREYADGDFAERSEAAVAAGNLLTRLRGEPVVDPGADGLPRI